MKKFIAALIPAIFLISSCSVSKKINRPAHRFLLNNGAFVHAHTGISIYEPATGKYWYNYQAEKYFTPASNTKLATCYAAMKYLGDSLVGIKYQELNDSTILIKGTADPSFLHSEYTNNPVFNFLKQYKLIVLINPKFDDYLGSGWGWDDYMEDYMAERSEMPIYGNTLKVKWISENNLSFMPSYFQKSSEIKDDLPKGFKVMKPWGINDFTFTNGKSTFRVIPFTPDRKTLLYLLQDTLHAQTATIENYPGQINNVIHSQPTDSLLKPMMHRSDNFFAEQTLLMVSERLLGEMSDRKIIDTLLKTDYKEMPQKPNWVDGSGLSRMIFFHQKILFSFSTK